MNKATELIAERRRLKYIRLNEADINRTKGLKKCSKCLELKPLAQFSKCSTKRDGFYHACKGCSAKYHRAHWVYSTSIKPVGKWSKLNPEIRKETRLNHYKENKDKINEKKRLWRTSHKELNSFQQFKDGIKRKYGLTLEQHQALIDKQENKCAICGHEMVDGRVGRYCRNTDHIHGTKKLRGILCNCCNKVIGYAYDDISVLENAIKYLKLHSHNLQGDVSNV